MFTKDASGIVYSSVLSGIGGLIHGFSTRRFGDMRAVSNKRAFLSSLGLAEYELYSKNQIHGTMIHNIGERTDITSLPDADGAILTAAGERNCTVVLSVRFADCVPLLFVSDKQHLIAVAHAGWRGTLGGITRNMVAMFRTVGVSPSELTVAIGAHIGPCCYDVPDTRARAFSEKFGNDPSVVRKTGQTWHVDLGEANKKELLTAGVSESSIDMDGICTACNVEDRFSYRKDTRSSYGVMMGVLAWKRA